MKLRSPSLWLRAALLWLLFGPLGTQAQPSSAAEPMVSSRTRRCRERAKQRSPPHSV